MCLSLLKVILFFHCGSTSWLHWNITSTKEGLSDSRTAYLVTLIKNTMEREAGKWTCSNLNMTVCTVGVSGATAGPPATDSAALLKDIVSQCMWRSLETHAAFCKCEVGQSIYFLPKSVWSDITWLPRQQMLGPFHPDFQTHLIMFPLVSGKTPLRAPKVPGSCVSHSEMSASTWQNKAEPEAYL